MRSIVGRWMGGRGGWIGIYLSTQAYHIYTQFTRTQAQTRVKCEVWAEPRELLEASCDMGDRPPAEMSNEFGPALDFGHLPPVWWCVGVVGVEASSSKD